MQNAIDDLLRLNGCDEAPTHHLSSASGTTGAAVAATSSPNNYESMAGYAPIKNGDQFCNSSEMQVDLALNEAVNSIL